MCGDPSWLATFSDPTRPLPPLSVIPLNGPLVLTVVVEIHLSEDLVCPLLWRRLVLWHLHHGGHHFVDRLRRRKKTAERRIVSDLMQEEYSWPGRNGRLEGSVLMPSL